MLRDSFKVDLTDERDDDLFTEDTSYTWGEWLVVRCLMSISALASFYALCYILALGLHGK
jgi:hypothetical protein